jgi:carbonic anhydrase/acetyltransferase-like protein (isoleucine patch superfamily)
VHGCTLKNNILVGMGAIIMDDVVIMDDCIIAAGALVTKGTIVEEGSVYAGVPAKKIKSIDKNLSEGEIKRIANSYNMYAGWYEL